MGLKVELESLAHFPSQVDAQRRDAQDRSSDVDELADVFSFFTDDDAASKTEITVEPGVPQTSSVGLDGELLKLLRLLLGAGLELQTRTVRVCSHDAKAVSWLVLLSDREGDEGGLVASEKVVSTLLEVPAVIFEDALEASGLKTTRELSNGVERRGREVDKVDKTLGFLEVGHGES